MAFLLDLVYLLLLLVCSPWLAYKAMKTGKYRRHLWSKLTGRQPYSLPASRVAWFHGVSVGEIHLLRQVVAAFRAAYPGWDCVISSTTDTGLEEARKHFPDLRIVVWPLDFSWAVDRALRGIQPSLLLLAEGELWPNMLHAAWDRDVLVAVLNARLSPKTARRYARVPWLFRWLSCPVQLFLAQSEDYASKLYQLGVGPDRVRVTGSVKYDGVQPDRAGAASAALRTLLGLSESDLVLVCGSTQAPEEEIACQIFQRASLIHANLRLLLVPRQRERFEEVARMLQALGIPFARRSKLSTTGPASEPIVLVDSIGELSALWSLADVAFVGGSLDGKRGGQNMIEPAAWGKAVLFGPHVWNFRETASRLLERDAAIQVRDARQLEDAVLGLLSSPSQREAMGSNARQFVLSQQGATRRAVNALAPLIAACEQARNAA